MRGEGKHSGGGGDAHAVHAETSAAEGEKVACGRGEDKVGDREGSGGALDAKADDALQLADDDPMGSPKKRARRSELTLERIQPTFVLPIKVAAATLNTSVNTLKRAARSHGIPSWPSRDITGLQSTIGQVQLSLQSSRSETERQRLSMVLQSLQQHVERLQETGQPPPEPK